MYTPIEKYLKLHVIKYATFRMYKLYIMSQDQSKVRLKEVRRKVHV